MRVHSLVCAALVAAMTSTIAWADDPQDPAMRDTAARERDREMVRQLNLQESAKVRERDARYARNWGTSRGDSNADHNTDYSTRVQDHKRAMKDYSRNYAQYEREMAEWRRATAACRAGDYSACGN